MGWGWTLLHVWLILLVSWFLKVSMQGQAEQLFCESLMTSPKPRGGELEGLACLPGKKGPLLPPVAQGSLLSLAPSAFSCN